MKNNSVPINYNDPFWSDISGAAEQKFGLPQGLLKSIVLYGERSNANQISEKGAKTPFQIIPQTRNAVLKQYGVDAYANPESAAEAAGLLLKESLNRNDGDIAATIAEYHGGTDRSNWGNKTKAYVNRVYEGLMKSSEQPYSSYASTPTISEGGQISTFRRALGDGGSTNTSVDQSSGMDKVYAAYKAGIMSPEEAREFEEDLRSGAIVVPGVDISKMETTTMQSAKNAQSNAASTISKMDIVELPQSVIEAYQSGQMNAQEMKDLESDIASGLVKLPDGSSLQQSQEPGLLDRIADVFTGNLRETDTTQTLQDWAAMPELNSFSVAGLKTGLGTLMSNPEETVQVIQANFPGVAVRQDEKGNFILRSSVDGQEYAIKPGFQVSDIPRAAGSLLAFSPAGKAATIPGAIAAGAGTQAAVEGAQKASGGSFDISDIVTSGALGGTANVVSRGIQSGSQGVKKFFSSADDVVSQAPDTAPQTAQQKPITTSSGEDLASQAKKAAVGGFGAKSARESLAQQATPDKKVLEAAKRLGIEDYLQPDHVTSSQAYRELTQALKSIPGSASRSAEIQGLEAVGKRANDLIEEIGGTKDLSQLNQNVRTRFETTIEALEKEAKQRFDNLRKEIPAQTRAIPENILGFVRQRAKDLNGYKNLSALEKDILSKLSPRIQRTKSGEVIGEVGPTYALIDDVRRDIGAATKGKGPFSDADVGRANELYALIRKDQGNIVESLGKGDDYKLANQVVVMRKGIEDDMQSLFGKEIDQSLVGKLSAATKALPQGDAQKFINIIKVIPKEMREHVVASSLNTAFGRATRDGTLNFNSFAQWYDGLRKNKQAYTALMSNLPLESRKKISDLYRVAKNISLATRERISTGRIQAVKDEFQDPDTVIARLYDIARRASVGVPIEALTTSIGLPGAGIASGITAALTRSSTKSIDAADKLLASPEFQKMITNANKEARKDVLGSSAFQRFAKSINLPNSLSNREKFLLNMVQSESQFNDESKK